MLPAFSLALAQLTDGRVLRILVKSLLAALAVFIAVSAGIWWAVDLALARFGLSGALLSDGAGVRWFVAAIGALAAGWFLWRIIALATLQFFADDVVVAIEEHHYPAAAATARNLPFHEELANSIKGAGRALGWNLLALPFYLLLLATGIGAPLVFLIVNAVLLGRELQDMVWLRHAPSRDTPAPLHRRERLLLGSVVAVLLSIPFVNLLAPFLGAAAATHLVHRKDFRSHVA